MKQDFYFRNEVHLNPFTDDLAVVTHKSPSKEVVDDVSNWTGGDAMYMTIEDNGIHGDGIIIQIKCQSRGSKNRKLLWCKLSEQGALGIASALSELMQMRRIQSHEKEK
jgi:hypothetical protein